MARSKYAQTLLGAVLSVALASLVGCMGGRGDTDGGGADENNGIGVQYVSDGGSGGRIELGVRGGGEWPTIGVGEEREFWVKLFDPLGAPLPFIRIFCESEKGIAIVDPSSGGVAFEHTGADGIMSGVIGGLVPGSYILECRAPEGFNLIARITIRIEGEVPEGFAGWPGAAGGNLGGGYIVDETEEAEEGEGIRLSFAGLRVASGTGTTVATNPFLDIDFIADCDIFDSDPSDPENWIADQFVLGVTNTSEEDIIVDTVEITILGPTTGTAVHSVQVVVPSGTTANSSGSANVVGQFVEPQVISGAKVLAGSGYALPRGTYPVRFRVSGSTDNGESFSASATISVTFDSVDNC